MSEFICVTCGTQYSEQPIPPDQCLICTEERQYVGWQGQQWTTLEQLRLDHRNRVAPEASVHCNRAATTTGPADRRR